ncbi:low affinity immunoglobulin gamma Fc region receptor II-c-like [Sander lucioperca]|uniref:low affinity immunoglobulin gamma Fc region receptor II-c-like n=1 Tax=Sander lucioperca TaxID=283035 RepID=UPI00125D4F07|nr:low affinity immunoglobulin gamma Fc region receptor II-c-like [Sander lucioperca]
MEVTALCFRLSGSVILESSVLPVMEGETVTLRCRNKTSSTNLPADFYKDGRLMKNSSGEEMTIKNVSKSDERLYKCSISGAGESPESWLAVRAKTISQSPNEDPLSKDSDSPRALILLWIAVTVLMVALVLLVVGFLHIRRRKASSKTTAAASHSVCGEDAEDDPDGVTYAVVVTKPKQDKDAGDTADNLNLCLESNHSTKPQSEREEDESSLQLVYSAVTIRKTPQALQRESSSTAAKTEQEGLYSPVLKATNSRDA